MVDSQPLQSSCRKPELPLIDYTAANAPDAFFESLKQYGFATLISHPLDMERVNRIYSAWRVHFSEGVPDEFAMDPVRQDGYFALDQAESAKGQQVRDHKEYFQFYRWGRCPGHLKHDLEAHFDDCLSFSTTLLRWVAEHLPPDIANRLSMPLESMIEDSAQTMLRVLHYPPVHSGIVLPRAAAHEDINLLTILPASDGPGLELQLSDGQWIEVVNRPSQVVINIGDMLQEATEGFLRSTTHRVALPNEGQAATGRMSLPLFLHPRPEVTLSSRYTADAYLGERLQELGVI
ncbi:MAG: isopenicillin N synthase family oxygenase [Gammaproteobacteria bacterium]|nr:isopenicillin N synthase family oxygenase [Gammaproteobacteria bacterium]